jgi:hypothetical protein
MLTPHACSLPSSRPSRSSPPLTLSAESLGGNARTCVVTCISPSQKQEDESISTLRFGVRAKKVPTPLPPHAFSFCFQTRLFLLFFSFQNPQTPPGHKLRSSEHAAFLRRHCRCSRRGRGGAAAAAVVRCPHRRRRRSVVTSRRRRLGITAASLAGERDAGVAGAGGGGSSRRRMERG